MTRTHIRMADGASFCGEASTGPRESISLQHWQVARTATDWMGLKALPVPLCLVCATVADVQPLTSWPSLGACGVSQSGRWLR